MAVCLLHFFGQTQVKLVFFVPPRSKRATLQSLGFVASDLHLCFEIRYSVCDSFKVSCSKYLRSRGCASVLLYLVNILAMQTIKSKALALDRFTWMYHLYLYVLNHSYDELERGYQKLYRQQSAGKAARPARYVHYFTRWWYKIH